MSVADDEDPGVGVTAGGLVAAAPGGAMDFTVTGEPLTDNFAGLPGADATVSHGSLTITRSGEAATYQPESDAACEDDLPTLVVPVRVVIETTAGEVNLDREGTLSTSPAPHDDPALWIQLEREDFGEAWLAWIADAEAAAVDDGCSILDPWIYATSLSDARVGYSLSAECPNLMATIANLYLAWEATEP